MDAQENQSFQVASKDFLENSPNLKPGYKPPLIIKDIFKISFFPSIVFMTSEIAYRLYPKWAEAMHFDSYLHFIGGMSIALSSAYIVNLFDEEIFQKNNRLAKAYLISTSVVVAAVLWEFYEFLHDQMYGSKFQPSIADTMKDLLLGMLGGITFCWLYLKLKLDKN